MPHLFSEIGWVDEEDQVESARLIRLCSRSGATQFPAANNHIQFSAFRHHLSQPANQRLYLFLIVITLVSI